LGCNCGKGRRQQAAVKAGERNAANGSNGTVTSLPQRPDRPTVSGSTMGPVRGQVQSFTLTLSGGRTQSFGSELEARAALARAGGRGSIA